MDKYSNYVCLSGSGGAVNDRETMIGILPKLHFPTPPPAPVR